MSKKLFIKPKDYEIKCCAVQIEIGNLENIKFTGDWEKDSNPENFEKMMTDKDKEFLMKPSNLAKEMGYVGMMPQLPYLYVLFDFNEQEKAYNYFLKVQEIGYKAKLVRNVVYADKRYLGGELKGRLVTLPPDYIDKAIRELFEKYGDEIVMTDDPVNDLLIYKTDLGGREITAFVGGGTKMLMLGMKNGYALQTKDPTRDYKRMIATFEKIILEWRNDHKGIIN